jgi:hypothetical protein
MVGKLTRDDVLSTSRLPVLLNASPYATPNELLQEMLDIDAGGQPVRIPQNEPMFWGDTLEGTILREAARRLGLTDLETNFTEPFEHPTLPLGASLDGRAKGSGTFVDDPSNGIYLPNDDSITLDGPILLEAKNTNAYPAERPALWRGPLQMQGQMMCTGIARGAVCVLHQGNQLRIYLYRKDNIVQSQITDAVLNFEERRKTREFYPAYSIHDATIVHSTTDTSARPVEIDDEDAKTALEDLVHAQKHKAMAEEDIQQASLCLMNLMGDAEVAYGLVGNQKYMVKWPSRHYKAQPEKVTPAKPARSMRSKTLVIKETD